jgi:hypothetical protein
MIDPGPIMVLLARLQEQVLQLEAALAQRDEQIRQLTADRETGAPSAS